MGYQTTISGEIRIEPPLTWPEIKSNPAYQGTTAVRLDIDEQSIDTPEGELISRSASSLSAAFEGPYKAYGLLSQVQAAVEAAPGHTFTGHLECSGEDRDDLWRLVVRNGTAVKVEPTIVWPDDAEGGASDGR